MERATPVFAVGAKVFADGPFVVVEHVVAPFAKGAYDGRPCAEGERPTHYYLKNHRANLVFVPTADVTRALVGADEARAFVERLRGDGAEPLDDLAALGFVVPRVAPRGARPFDVNRLDLSLADNVRVLHAYYAMTEAEFAEGPAAWIPSFERVVLGELALALDRPFESLRDELHSAHDGVRAYDAGAPARDEARKRAMERERKRKKKPTPLP